jgi:hypothetical protein
VHPRHLSCNRPSWLSYVLASDQLRSDDVNGLWMGDRGHSDGADAAGFRELRGKMPHCQSICRRQP